jgi:predicted DNA-binding protein YlxM (UPF0122 family)
MKNYKKSDYAINKYSDGIVYKYANGHTTEYILEDYLAENPDKTEQDFTELKKLSDEIYLEQDRAEYNQTRKNISVDSENFFDSTELPFEEEFIETLDREQIVEAFNKLLGSGELSETQERRLRFYILDGFSHRKIAEIEGVTYHAVAKTLKDVIRMIKKFFKNFKN